MADFRADGEQEIERKRGWGYDVCRDLLPYRPVRVLSLRWDEIWVHQLYL